MRHILVSLAMLLTPLWVQAAEFAIATGVAKTSTGTTDYTVAGFGTPKCALIFGTYGTANGTAVAHGGLAIGATDGTNHAFLSAASEDNVATTDTGGSQNAIDTFKMVSVTAQSTTDGSATGSLIADGVQLNTTDAFAAAYQLKVLLIGGSGVYGCKVGSLTTNAVLNASVTASTGFQSDVILFWSMADVSATPANNTICLGGYVRDGSHTQGSMCLYDATNQATSALAEMLTTGHVARRVGNGVNGPAAEVGNVTSTGFDVTSRDSVIAQMNLYYLALDLDPALSAKIITDASPTATGSESITGVGWTPQLAIGLYGAVLANNTHYSDGNAESIGVGLMTAATSACLGMTSDDGVSPSNTESLTDTKALCLQKDGALFQEATLTSFDADGVTFNHGTANGTARQRMFLFVKQGALSTTRNRAGMMLP